MNALVESIRARVAHGYHMTKVGTAIEDVKDLLELVDKLVLSHYDCGEFSHGGRYDCVYEIMEELGIANPSQT